MYTLVRTGKEKGLIKITKEQINLDLHSSGTRTEA